MVRNARFHRIHNAHTLLKKKKKLQYDFKFILSSTQTMDASPRFTHFSSFSPPGHLVTNSARWLLFLSFVIVHKKWDLLLAQLAGWFLTSKLVPHKILCFTCIAHRILHFMLMTYNVSHKTVGQHFLGEEAENCLPRLYRVPQAFSRLI